MLATLRREADAYRTAGADVEFVGHPAVDLVRPSMDPATARQHFGIPAQASIVGLMPGSRPQEIRAHLPVMVEAARRLQRARPEVWFVVPVPAADLVPLVAPPVSASGLVVRIVSEIYDAMAIADVLVVATGTATLEATLLGIPMVAVYRLPWLSWIIARCLVNVPYAALPNILAGREIVPELLQGRMSAHAIVQAVDGLLSDSQRRAEMKTALRQVAADLGPPGAVARAALEILTRLPQPSIAASAPER